MTYIEAICKQEFEKRTTVRFFFAEQQRVDNKKCMFRKRLNRRAKKKRSELEFVSLANGHSVFMMVHSIYVMRVSGVTYSVQCTYRTLVGRQIVLVNVRIALCQLTLLRTNIERYTIDMIRMQQFLLVLCCFISLVSYARIYWVFLNKCQRL